jgi:hypothetical protein
MAARICAALGALAILGAFPVLAAARHGSFEARAKRPAYDSGALQLVGVGGYGTTRRHTQVRVTVCLSKRYRGQFFDINCTTASSGRKVVKARVTVPGCVKGVWRTSAVGQALDKSGTWSHDSSDLSPPFRCS